MDTRTFLITLAQAELRDGRALVLAVATGVGLMIVGADVPSAAIAALAVESVKALASIVPAALARRRRRITDHDAAAWVGRAELALDTLRRLARSSPRGALASRFTDTAARAAATVWVMRRLAEQGSSVARLLDRVPERDIPGETALLERELATTADARLRDELMRSLASLRTQTEVRAQLAASHQAVLARMRTVALGMESLVARVAELIAIAATGVTSPDDRLDELDAQLEALREGLLETERIGDERIARLTSTSLMEVTE